MLLIKVITFFSSTIIFALLANSTSVTRGPSEITHGFERVLLRRKRYLLFPKGAAVSCTISMVKALVFKGPRGYNTVCEADYFYTLPDKPDSLRPKRKHLKATSAIPTTTTPVPELHYDEHHHDHHAEFSHDDHYSSLFVPDSSWQDNPTDILAASSPVYPPSSKERLWQKYLHPKYNSKSSGQSLPQKRISTNKVSSMPVSNRYYSKQRGHYKPRSRYIKDTQSPVSSYWEDHHDWKHFEGHRTRRDLYQSLERMIDGIDLQPCLLRTICEAQHFLLPKGKSLFHDIFRIIFTLPVKEEFKDSYSHAVRAEPAECQIKYHNDCPISILAFFIKSNRTI